MTKHIKHKLSSFLSDYPLYKEFKAVENFSRTSKDYSCPTYLHGETFSYYCEKEEGSKTFELLLPNKSWFEGTAGEVPKEVIDENGFLDYTLHFIGFCKSCKKFKVDFLLHVRSDNPIPTDESNTMILNKETLDSIPIDELQENRANIYIEKVGVKPVQRLEVDNKVLKYFDRESSTWYYKALKSLNENLGIASFAYFRRILEKELVEIIEDISKLTTTEPKLKDLIAEYKNNKKINSIYENIFPFLPKSLQSLGENPIKILYKQTSEGLHSLSENQCLERAKEIDLILRFVIKSIKEEESEILLIRDAIKKLNE